MQQSAMTSGISKILHIDRERNEYTFFNEKVSLSSFVRFGYLKGAKGPPSDPTKLINFPITFDGGDVVFYPDGKIRPGAVYLIDEQEQVCYALTVPIAHTSSIYKYRYNHVCWERI